MTELNKYFKFTSTMNIVILLLILLAALISSSGQLLMKKGSSILQQTLSTNQSQASGLLGLVKKFFSIIFEPHVFVALIFYFLGLFVWLKILTKSDLGQAYPILISLTVLLTSIFSAYFFKESFTIWRGVGIALIIAGLFFITYATKQP